MFHPFSRTRRSDLLGTYDKQRTQLLGKRAYRRKKGVKRRGHQKKGRTWPSKTTAHRSPNAHGAGEHLARELIDEDAPAHCETEHLDLLRYVSNHVHRMDYPALRERGLQIGSGAMESLHRTGSQLRVKRPGTRWLAKNALSVIRVRMMNLAERWPAFWDADDLTPQLVQHCAHEAWLMLADREIDPTLLDFLMNRPNEGIRML